MAIGRVILAPRPESKEAIEAYEAYQNLGFRRSLAKVSRILRKDTSLIERWSAKYHWRERVRPFDKVMYSFFSQMMSQKGKIRSAREAQEVYDSALVATLQRVLR